MTPEHIWVQRRVPKLTNYAKKYPGYTDHWDILKIPYAHLNGYLNRKWLLVPDQLSQSAIDRLHQERLENRSTKYGRLTRPEYVPQSGLTSRPESTQQHHQRQQSRTTPPVTQKIITKEE